MIKRNILNKMKAGLISLGFMGFLSNGFLSCQNSQSQQNKQTKNLEDSIKTTNQNYNHLDTIKSANDLKEFKNLLELIIQDTLGLNENKPNYLKNSNYKFSENDLKKFNSWVELTLNESKKQNKNAILINKSEYALYIIKSGKLNSKYPIELGGNPFDDKKIEGDACTPEGLYKVAMKKDKGQSVFYKAFLLNYPNAEDLKNKKTGSTIEVHGSGSGSPGNADGHNWTLGCMALSNKDIDEIFPYINRNDRITIVGYTDIDLDKKLFESRVSKHY